MFTINNEYWDVISVESNDEILLMPNDEFAIGVCDDITNTIYLSNELQGEDYKEALCHELIHAAISAYDIHLSYNEEEHVAELLSLCGEEIFNLTQQLAKGRF